MSKFAFKDPAFHQNPRNVATYPGGPQAAQNVYAPPPAPAAGSSSPWVGQAGSDAATDARLEGMYAAPPAGAIETDRMTVEDTIHKTLASFGVLIVAAALGWFISLSNPGLALGVAIVGAVGGLILGLVNGFKRMPGAALVIAYSAFEGVFIGAFSMVMEYVYPGIVMQATLATLAVVGVTLVLFANGKVRTSPRMNKIFLVAMLGYLAFSLLNAGFMIFGGPFSDSAWGMRSGVEIAGIPLGVIIGILAVLMGAYSLVMDFEYVQNGAAAGAPRKLGWKAAFGIVATVVWIYVEILRILAILRGND